MLVLVAVGGALGALARYEVGLQTHAAMGSFPWPTFVINMTGSFALGLLVALVGARFPTNRWARPLLGVGFLGGYTTFSTFAVEADLLVRDGHAGLAAVYVMASVLGGVAACAVGAVAGRPR